MESTAIEVGAVVCLAALAAWVIVKVREHAREEQEVESSPERQPLEDLERDEREAREEAEQADRTRRETD